MFNRKKETLFGVSKKTSVKSEGNAFVAGAKKQSAKTRSGNDALKYSTTGNPFVDQFGMLGLYKEPRDYATVAQDCETLYNRDRNYAIKFIFYLRMITRTVTLPDGSSTSEPQKGAELKHESILRMIWLHLKEPKTFWDNIGLFVAAGSWKDIFVMLRYDLIYNGWNDRKLDWEKFGDLILSGLKHEGASELIKKYLPQIKAKSKCTTVEAQANTIVGKWLASLLFSGKEEAAQSYKKYRQLKAAGTAHEWQQLISQRKFKEIDFSKIHGRALTLLVKGKFLSNQGLTQDFTKFAKEAETMKATGFAHEVMNLCARYQTETQMPTHELDTVNKQFMELVNKAGEDQTDLIVARDTSGSMDSTAFGTNMSSNSIARAIALYFSYFLKGRFEGTWIEFAKGTKLHEWQGDSPTSRWFGDNSEAYGRTNFQSVIDLFCDLKAQGIPQEEFPSGILCISDGEFDQASLNTTNVSAARQKMVQAGFDPDFVENFSIVLWNITNTFYGRPSGNKFETYGNAPGTFYFSGYSPAVISFLQNGISTPMELFEAALDQELINAVKV